MLESKLEIACLSASRKYSNHSRWCQGMKLLRECRVGTMDLAGWAGRCLHGASDLAAHIHSPSLNVVPTRALASVMWEFKTYTSGAHTAQHPLLLPPRHSCRHVHAIRSTQTAELCHCASTRAQTALTRARTALKLLP